MIPAPSNWAHLAGFWSSLSFWTPKHKNLGAGLSYEPALRFSNAAKYEYQDHRIILKLVWNIRFDPWLPREVQPANHTPLDYALGTAAEDDDELWEMLRQNDIVQRSSSCVE